MNDRTYIAALLLADHFKNNSWLDPTSEEDDPTLPYIEDPECPADVEPKWTLPQKSPVSTIYARRALQWADALLKEAKKDG